MNQFLCLGTVISDDGTCTAEIKSRIAMAKNAFKKRRELFSKKLSKNLKKNVIMTIICSVALYGSETMTLRKYERDRLEAFEMWTWRNMKYQLEGSHDQRICVRSSYREKKAFKYNIRKEKTMAWTHL